jgi:hypothetical protein
MILTPTTQPPPPARNPNYRGSGCLTLTSGQLMYPQKGRGNSHSAPAWFKILTPVHVAFSTRPTTTTPTLTQNYTIISVDYKPYLLILFSSVLAIPLLKSLSVVNSGVNSGQ